MLEFVDSGLYFVQDENNFINPLLQVVSGTVKKSTGSCGPKINGSDRIRIWILIPAENSRLFPTFYCGCPYEKSLKKRLNDKQCDTEL